MPRKPRLHFPGALYHVIGRGNGGQDIFLSPEDRRSFLNFLAKTRERTPFQIYAYCLMPNHFHLLMEVSRSPLSQIMQRFLTTYVHHFNKTYGRRGHLLQGRYKAILCQKDTYLLELIRYIHLNPVRARLCRSPSDWKWSGHNAYLGKTQDPLLDARKLLSLFAREPSAARKNYADFVREGLSMGHRTDFYPEEKIPYLGEGSFIEDLSILHEKKIQQITPDIPSPEATLKELMNETTKIHGLPAPLIASSSRYPHVITARQEFMHKAIAGGHKACDIARFLSLSPSALSKFLLRCSKKESHASQA